MDDKYKKDLIGKTIEKKYQILSILGEGGMSIVYKAKDLTLNRLVAVKILLPEFALKKSFRERFIREAQTSAKLNHPNIVAIHSVGVYNNLNYFVMDYVEGVLLKTHIHNNTPLNYKTVWSIIHDLLLAIEYAHTQDIIHRDLKPANIIITKKNKSMIMDFGIAKVSNTDKLTQTGMTIGTAEYMSPEQIKGGKIDYRSDFYSIGVILYEMLTGILPFKADDQYSTGVKHLMEKPQPPKNIVNEIPKHINDLILKLLSKNPSDRFQSVKNIIAAFKINTDETKHEKKTRCIHPVKITSRSSKQNWLWGFCILIMLFFGNYNYYLYKNKKDLKRIVNHTSHFIVDTIINSTRDFLFPVHKTIELNILLDPLINQEEIAYIAVIDAKNQISVFKGDVRIQNEFVNNILNNLSVYNPNSNIYNTSFYLDDQMICTYSKVITIRAVNREFNMGYISIGVYYDTLQK